MIPPFTSTGLLPAGVHSATWPEFISRFGGTSHRAALIGMMKQVLINLRDAGCISAYIDGIFVTEKQIPSDYDMCWDMHSASGGYINDALLDPVLLDFTNQRKAMKAKYGGDIFPADFLEAGSGKTFLDFFQNDKQTGAPKGIVLIDPRAIT